MAPAISRLKREIEFLHEYHTCLVAGAVTGKLDVREAAARYPEAADAAFGETGIDGTEEADPELTEIEA